MDHTEGSWLNAHLGYNNPVLLTHLPFRKSNSYTHEVQHVNGITRKYGQMTHAESIGSVSLMKTMCKSISVPRSIFLTLLTVLFFKRRFGDTVQSPNRRF
jgi:hypothetical protein